MKILKRLNITENELADLPLKSSIKLKKSELLNSSHEARYSEMIGCLIHLSFGTRPDLLVPTLMLSKYNNNPSKDHIKSICI